jgi:glycosyltransferase involved in cell wall biosynthesis
MRILLIHNYYQQRGGEDECAEQDGRLLRSRGHEVSLYSRHNDEIKALSLRGKVILFLETLWSRRTVRDIRRMVAEFKPDVAHVHNFFPLISPSVFHACKAAGVPVLYTLHNYRLMCPTGWFFRNAAACEDCATHSLWQGLRYRCYHESRSQTAAVALMLWAHRRLRTWQKTVTAYVVLSEFSRRKFEEAGLPANRLFLRRNFQEATPSRDEQPRSGALFVGRLSREKGVEFLLRSWRQLPEVPLTLLGDGPLRLWVERYVTENGMRQVQIAGFRPQAEIVQRLRSAEVLIVPSLWYEVCIRMIIEAYAAGTPVVASRLGSLVDMVSHGQTGLLFNPEDEADLAAKVKQAIANPPETERWGREARIRFKRDFSPDVAYTRLLDIYAMALDLQNRKPTDGDPISS